jgi:lipid-binding SYLF domain-containing protein
MSDQSENRRSRVRILGGATKFFAAASAALALVAALPSQSQAATGTVRLHVVKAGVVIGGSNGEGVLYFGHRRYHLRVTGSGVGTLGVATVDLVGTVSNLRRPSDIVGSYSDSGAGLALGGGASAATLQNDRGVVLQLQGPQTGLQIALSVGAMTIAIQ